MLRCFSTIYQYDQLSELCSATNHVMTSGEKSELENSIFTPLVIFGIHLIFCERHFYLFHNEHRSIDCVLEMLQTKMDETCESNLFPQCRLCGITGNHIIGILYGDLRLERNSPSALGEKIYHCVDVRVNGYNC